MTRSRALAAALVLVLAAPACRRQDPVRALLAALEQAAEDRDAGELGERLAEDFRGAGGVDRVETVATARRYLAAYESILLELYDVTITPGDGEATVHLRVDFSGSARRLGGLQDLLPPSASYVFELKVAPRGGVWKVTQADWRSALAASP